jgi:hypothetical protein
MNRARRADFIVFFVMVRHQFGKAEPSEDEGLELELPRVPATGHARASSIMKSAISYHRDNIRLPPTNAVHLTFGYPAISFCMFASVFFAYAVYCDSDSRLAHCNGYDGPGCTIGNTLFAGIRQPSAFSRKRVLHEPFASVAKIFVLPSFF